MSEPRLYGLPVLVSPLVPEDSAMIVAGAKVVLISRINLWRLSYPGNPVLSERTLGHREMRRAQRLRAKAER